MEEYLAAAEQMSEKKFCSNVAPSLGSGPPRNTEIRSDSKLSQDSDVTHRNQLEKNTKPIEKELGQSELQGSRKIQKTTRKC